MAAIHPTAQPAAPSAEATAQHPHPVRWTIGTLLLVVGLYLLAYVGGLHINDLYEQEAARGDSTLVPAAVETLLPTQPEAEAFVVPVLNTGAGDTEQPASEAQQERSTVTRIAIPKLDLDWKVIEVGWTYIEENGIQNAVWEVAKYAVGHHRGSANPGGGDNIVLAGHVGGTRPVFDRIIDLQPGDQLTLYSEGRQYLYVVQESLLVQEVGVPEEQRRANAIHIAPTEGEQVTLITCWPPDGPHQFDQRLIVKAVPYGVTNAAETGSSWSLR